MTKAEILKYIKANEFDFARANAALIACDLVFRDYVESDRVHGSPFSPVFCYISYEKLKSFYQIIAKKIISDTGKKIYVDYLADEKSLDEKMAEHLKLEKELDRLWQEYLKSRGGGRKDKLIGYVDEYFSVFGKWWQYGAIGEDKGAVINEVITPKFAKRHNLALGKANEIFNTLSHPEEKTILNIEREKFLEICLELDQGRGKEKIRQYVEDYFWIKTDFYKAEIISEESVLAEAKRELAEKSAGPLQAEFKKILESHSRLHAEKKKLLAEFPLSAEDKKDIAFAEKTILWVDRRKLGTMKNFYYLLRLVADVAKEAGLAYHDLAIYTGDEFSEYVRTGKRIPAEEVRGRADGIMIKYEKGLPAEKFYGSDSDEMFQAVTAFKHNGRSIKGQVASTGGLKKVVGKARIVHQPSEEEFNEGEILVTSMTRIEFVPVMRKALAVITDEGGIACHAAIVSRELGIPCIIGTKIGTRTLKAGDEVELDLEKGIVRKVLK